MQYDPIDYTINQSRRTQTKHAKSILVRRMWYTTNKHNILYHVYTSTPLVLYLVVSFEVWKYKYNNNIIVYEICLRPISINSINIGVFGSASHKQ